MPKMKPISWIKRINALEETKANAPEDYKPPIRRHEKWNAMVTAPGTKNHNACQRERQRSKNTGTVQISVEAHDEQ